jgi:hypothetical protein
MAGHCKATVKPRSVQWCSSVNCTPSFPPPVSVSREDLRSSPFLLHLLCSSPLSCRAVGPLLSSIQPRLSLSFTLLPSPLHLVTGLPPPLYPSLPSSSLFLLPPVPLRVLSPTAPAILILFHIEDMDEYPGPAFHSSSHSVAHSSPNSTLPINTADLSSECSTVQNRNGIHLARS